MKGRASRRRTSSASSTSSIASTPRTGSAPAPGSALPSAAASSKRSAAPSAPATAATAAAPCSPSAFLPRAPRPCPSRRRTMPTSPALRHGFRGQGEKPLLVPGELRVDLVRRGVRRGGELAHLAPKEYDLLAELVANAGKVLAHRHILGKVWGPALVEDAPYLRVFIR